MHKVLLLILLCFTFSSGYGTERELNIVFIPKSSDQGFWLFMRNGVDQAIDEIGNISLTWRGPRYNDDTDAQIRILETYTRPEVDAIIIAATDQTRLMAPIKKAAEAGIAIVAVDSAVRGNYQQNSIMTDNYAAGILAARHLSGLLQAQGNVVVFRTVAASASTINVPKASLITSRKMYLI